MWMGFILQTLLIVIPISSLSQSVKTSKACYGSDGLPCTRHTLVCSSGIIAIQDAYYTNSTACTRDGLSNCGNISVSSIPDTGRHQDLKETQWIDLNKNCSTKSNCTFNGGRKSAIVAFTVLKYICITDQGTPGAHAGGVAGGVFAAVVVIGAVVALVFWFKNKKPRVKTGKQDDSYSEVTAVSKNVYKDVTSKPRSNYDYATVNDDIKSTGHVRIDNYDMARTPVGNIKTQQGEPKVIEEDEYNHLDDQKQITINGDKPSGYDTTASAAAAMRKLQNKSSSNREDDYYNHLGNNSDVKPVGVDYDTAESASRAVAQMVKDKDTTEDDYDHFHKIEAKTSDSPYNTTERCVNETDYSLARSVDKKDPYDLAK